MSFENDVNPNELIKSQIRNEFVNNYLLHRDDLEIHFPDAPSDNSLYGRKDGGWEQIISEPAGNNTEIQFNSNGSFGSSSDLTFTNNEGLNVNNELRSNETFVGGARNLRFNSTTPTSIIESTADTRMLLRSFEGRIDFETGSNNLALELDNNQNALFSNNVSVDNDLSVGETGIIGSNKPGASLNANVLEVVGESSQFAGFTNIFNDDPSDVAAFGNREEGNEASSIKLISRLSTGATRGARFTALTSEATGYSENTLNIAVGGPTPTNVIEFLETGQVNILNGSLDVNNDITVSGSVDGVDISSFENTTTTHINNDSLHREIDDTATSTTGLWSSNKINSELENVEGEPAGNNTEIQFNSNGSFGASSSLTWDGNKLNIENDNFPLLSLNRTANVANVVTRYGNDNDGPYFFGFEVEKGFIGSVDNVTGLDSSSWKIYNDGGAEFEGEVDIDNTLRSNETFVGGARNLRFNSTTSTSIIESTAARMLLRSFEGRIDFQTGSNNLALELDNNQNALFSNNVSVDNFLTVGNSIGSASLEAENEFYGEKNEFAGFGNIFNLDNGDMLSIGNRAENHQVTSLKMIGRTSSGATRGARISFLTDEATGFNDHTLNIAVGGVSPSNVLQLEANGTVIIPSGDLDVSGDLTVGGSINNGGSSSSPSGDNGAIQFNDVGQFGGSDTLSIDINNGEETIILDGGDLEIRNNNVTFFGSSELVLGSDDIFLSGLDIDIAGTFTNSLTIGNSGLQTQLEGDYSLNGQMVVNDNKIVLSGSDGEIECTKAGSGSGIIIRNDDNQFYEITVDSNGNLGTQQV